MDKYEVFQQWLSDNGAHFSMLELRAYDDGNSTTKNNNNDNDTSNENDDSTEEKKETTKNDGDGMMMITAANTSSSSSTPPATSTAASTTATTTKNKEDSEMRGVHAKVSIPPDSVCVAIPRKCLITVEMGQSTPIGQTILKSNLDLDAPKHIFLMIFLLWDRSVNGTKSFFKPYYDILPQTLRNIPIFWTNEELNCLQGSYLLTQIADRNEAITEDYNAICAVSPELKEIATLEEFKWARMCVCSRNFGLQINGHRTSALVPHADMFNHYRPRETKWTYDDDLQAFTITTLQTIHKGAQVYDSYGQKCNHRFLLNYGFAVEDNREFDGYCPNEVPIELTLSIEDSLYNEKCDFFVRGEDDGTTTGSGGGGGGGGGNSSSSSGAGMGQKTSAVSVVQSAMGDITTGGTTTSSSTTTTTNTSSFKSSPPVRSRITTNNGTFSNMGGGEPLSKRIRICVSNNENTRVLFSMLRVFACDADELNSISSPQDLSLGGAGCPAYVARALRGLSADHSGMALSHHVAFYRTFRDIRHPISVRNEQLAMRILLDTIGRTLDQYTCSLAQDVTDLLDESSYPRFSNKRHAKIQVRGEKEVLHHYALWARTALDVLAVIEREVAIENGENVAGDEVPKGGFEYVIRAMEDEDGINDELHPTIVRYCADVLGSLYREEMKKARRNRSTER